LDEINEYDEINNEYLLFSTVLKHIFFFLVIDLRRVTLHYML